MRALLVLAVSAACLGLAAATLGDNGMTTYTGRKREPNTLVFGNQLVIDQAVQATLDTTRDFLKGTWRPSRNEPATEKKEVQLECLNSVAPEPLNWKMWCPGTDAKVMGWIDQSGAAHRQITLRPQRGMTSTMYQWFITAHVLGLMPPVVEFQGNKYYYYHLWHPLDHVEAAWSIGPVNPLTQKGPPLYTLIHERYRNPANFPYDRHYETNGWFFVENSIVNLMKNRYVITMPLLGLPTWTMILEFNDTPEGLVVDIEVVAGIPYKGYDERSPLDGYAAAAGMNEMLTAPLLSKQKGSPDWEESINAITRHTIEEFSNLQFFVPQLYERHTILGAKGINWIPTLGTWLQFHGISRPDSQTISFYHALAAMGAKQINVANTTHGQAVDAAHSAATQAYKKMTDAATAVVEGKSQATYVPASNALTKYAYESNKARGAHPEADISIPAIKRSFIRFAKEGGNVTADASGSGNKTISLGLGELLSKGFGLHHKNASADGNATATQVIDISLSGGGKKNGSHPFMPFRIGRRAL